MDVNSLNSSAAASFDSVTAVQRKAEQPQNTAERTEAKTLPVGTPVKADSTTKAVNEYDERSANEMLESAMAQANKKIAPTTTQLSYSVHKVTKDIMIKILNSETKEVIRELPPEKNLDAVAKMWELAGILVDERR